MADDMRSKYDILIGALESERSSFISHWRDLSDFLLPRRAQFTLSDTNRGDKKNNKIINSTGTLAARTLRSGMMAGVTSPARPWFRLTTQDPDLAELGAVKEWLHIVTQRMATTFLRSNLYNALPIVYGDLGTFGTSAIAIEEDFDTTVRFYVFPIGTYSIANNEKGAVDVFMREIRWTVRQVVKKFGTDDAGNIDLTRLSLSTRSKYEAKQLDAWVDLYHIVHANNDYDPKALASNKKRYRSVYYEKGTANEPYNGEGIKYLSDKGFDQFNVLTPRWEVSGGDVYGTSCPGMICLGDVKSLQLLEKRKAQAIEKKVNPPMVGNPSLKQQRASILPGDITYLDERDGRAGFRPAHEVSLSITELYEDINAHEQRIRRAYYEDLFLMLAMSDRRQITAREVEERHEEKLLALGPVLEQLNQDLLNPLIDITFEYMLKQGQVPEPPEELQNQTLKVDYISIMHQAQKLAGLAGIERFTGFVGQVSGYAPDVLDKIDADQLIDEYSDIVGVPPRIVRPDDAVESIREGRRQAQVAQEQMAMAQQQAKMATDLSKADLGGDNALSELIRRNQAGAVV